MTGRASSLIFICMHSYSHIQVLPIHVANKIAAGEVVDRPASVAKELIENAIDAGSTQIDVEVTAGGRKLVAVRDNGSGMNRDDALLSIERQATSKIRDVDDIEKIDTLGFRGEALAAIASVSRFRLITHAHDAEIGTELLISGGKIRDVTDIGGPVGTSIEVRDLFFNVPARRKFLRSQQTELTHIRTGFIVQALAHPKIGMSLKVDGRETYRLAPGSVADPGNTRAALQDRIRDLFGSDYLLDLKRASYTGREVTVTGYTGLPSQSRTDRYEQYIFVNGRATSAAMLNYAIREGYHTLLPKNRHPVVFLFLEMDPELVDVNVHPTKKEVRFRHPSEVRDTVITAIHEALESKLPPINPLPEGELLRPDGTGVAPATEMRLEIEDLPSARVFKYPRLPMQTENAAQELFAGSTGENKETDVATGKCENTAPWAWCRVVGQVGELYVILETEDGYAVMDPHAAHERVLFERYMSDILKREVLSQSLLLPETVEFKPGDATRLRKSMELFQQMGFGISEFGGDSFVVDALPAFLTNVSITSLLTEMALSLEQSGYRGGTQRWREESIAQAACKSAVKARDKLTLKEMEQLIVDLAATEMPYTCPHGRPTLMFTSFKDLNKKFARE